MRRPHFSDYPGIEEALIGFVQLARRKGMSPGVAESLSAMELLQMEELQDRNFLRYSLQALFCCSEDDLEVFESIFDYYWGNEPSLPKGKTSYKNQSNLVKKQSASLVMLGEGESAGDENESSNVSGANAVERLRKTDFSKLTPGEAHILEEIALKLWRQMSFRLKRRMRSAAKGERVSIRQTIRHNISKGGDPIDLRMQTRKPRKQRLIVLLDVSGSMDKYSYFLLRFIWSLRNHFKSVEAFIFSTRLIRVTDMLQVHNLELTLSLMSQYANNWSSGTKIGECFAAFNRDHSKKVLNGDTSVIVLSDGLDTGDPDILRKELAMIRRRTKRVIWLNPLKGMQGYEPVQRGMNAALGEIDVFRSAHSLDSLLELEDYLMRI